MSAAEAGIPAASSSSLEPLEGEVWYLAFGSNMSPKVLTGRRKVKPMSSLACTAPGYTLGFHYKGIPYLEPGFATVAPLAAEMQQLKRPGAAQQTQQPLTGEIAVQPSLTQEEGKGYKATPGEEKQVIRLRAGSAQALKAPKAPVSGGVHTCSIVGKRHQGELEAGSAKPSAVQQAFQLMASVLAFITAQNEQGPAHAVQPSGIYGQPLHGVVHLIKREEWEAVQQSEGVGDPKSGYQVVQVKCCLYDGDWLTAETLMAAPSCLGDPHEVLPSRRYIQILQEGARFHSLDPTYCELLDAQPSYDTAPRGKRLGSWIMRGLLLSCTLWLVPLLVLLALFSRIQSIIMLFFSHRVVPYVKVKNPRTAALTKHITSPISVRFIRALSAVTHTLHDWILCPLLGSGFR